jgi:aminoglycoside phosphotransferase (APT) family kinase protein
MPDVTPPPAAVEQAVQLAGPDATVQTMQALAGGTHAHTTLIRTANPETEVILREFPPFDDAARREAKVLRVLDGLDGLTPQLLASDTGHETSGHPWLLISRLPGSADITPRDPAAQAGQLGRTLARIHQTPLRRLAGLPRVFDRPDGALTGISGPAADIVAASWETLASTPRALAHHDFWSGNVVWEDEVLTGVVDWSGGCLGPPGIDTGWCRLDLYLLHGQAIADAFLNAYRAATGSAQPDPLLWDLWAVARSHEIVETWVPNYRDLGRADLTAAQLRSRHTEWASYLLAQAVDGLRLTGTQGGEGL